VIDSIKIDPSSGAIILRMSNAFAGKSTTRRQV